MPKTILRRPLSVSTSSNDYPKEQILDQVDFKGLADGKNDIMLNASTFADVKNVYVDENDLLVSRAPFKFVENEGYILHQWTFGDYTFRLQRVITDEADNIISNEGMSEELLYSFVLSCTTHITIEIEDEDIYAQYIWRIPCKDVENDFVPKITVTQIEDKIFFWFNGVNIIAFNTVGYFNDEDKKYYPYFEDAQKYLYIPLSKIITNGLDSEYEDTNFFTDSHKERRLLSTISSVNFDALIGETFEVNMTSGEGDMQYLYDVIVGKNQAKTIIYPFTVIGENYYVDIVQTPRATVIMRFGERSKSIEISFDGIHFNQLPYIDGILGKPILTRDGLGVVVFTELNLMKCKLIAQESADFSNDGFIQTWIAVPYFQHAIVRGLPVIVDSISTDFVPNGYFNTLDQFTYIVRVENIYNPNKNGIIPKCECVYAEWLNTKPIGGYAPLIDTWEEDGIHYIETLSPNVGFSIVGKYYSALLNSKDGMVVSIGSSERRPEPESGRIDIDTWNTSGDNISVVFENKQIYTDNLIYSGDQIILSHNRSKWYIYKLTADLKYIVTDREIISPGDAIIVMNVPENTPWKHKIIKNGISYYRDSTAREYALVYTANRYIITTNATKDVIEFGDEIILTKQKIDMQYTGYDRGNIYGYRDAVALAAFYTYVTEDGENIILPMPDDKILTERVENTEEEKSEAIIGSVLLGTSVDYYGPYRKSLGTSTETDCVNNSPISINISAIENSSKKLIYRQNLVYQSNDGDMLLKTEWVIDKENNVAMPEATSKSVVSNFFSKNYAFDSVGNFATSDYLYIDDEVIALPPISGDKIPLSFSDKGVWYLIGDRLWTSQLQSDIIVNLDTYINCNVKSAIYNGKIPTHCKTLDEHYFAFEENGKHLLQISSTRRDETDERNYQLYLPINNEQTFTQKITNLQSISDTTMAIFTGDDVWYMSSTILNDNLVYTKPVKSKIPLGCRDGDDITMAFDGQAIILPTKRGIAVMKPEAFLTDTEQSLTYLSDVIQDKYLHFYNDPIYNALNTYKPQIKIKTYRYWVLFYKYMSREILVLDTRNNAWWVLNTSYPIMQLDVRERLYAIMRIDYKPSTKRLSLLGLSFVFKDDEMRAVFKEGEFPQLSEDIIQYTDDIIVDTLNGDYVEKFENEFVGTRKIYELAKSDINWHFVSQRLHFGQINNYKKIKSIILNLKGTKTNNAKLSTKVFRDLYHPEQSDTLEMKINDTKTFTEYLNLMHVIDFQYRLENDATFEPSQFRLNGVGVKYEVKEKIR